jgi:hypothetical protein
MNLVVEEKRRVCGGAWLLVQNGNVCDTCRILKQDKSKYLNKMGPKNLKSIGNAESRFTLANFLLIDGARRRKKTTRAPSPQRKIRVYQISLHSDQHVTCATASTANGWQFSSSSISIATHSGDKFSQNVIATTNFPKKDIKNVKLFHRSIALFCYSNSHKAPPLPKQTIRNIQQIHPH